jgi:hypothetical protein
MSLSNRCDEKSAQYVGVLNGVVYRLDADMNICGPVFRQAPQDVPPASVRAARPTPAAAIVVQCPPAATPADDGNFEDLDPASRPFHRESADPLRAGHPDLWHLLIAGTCLEGSPYPLG